MNDSPTYIKVIFGPNEGARGYIIGRRNIPNVFTVQLYKDGIGKQTNIRTQDFEIIKTDRRCKNE